MKVEMKMNESQVFEGKVPEENDNQVPSCEVAIDVGHVLAANQALLKNMARKMEVMEKKLTNLETAYAEQSLLLEAAQQKRLLLTQEAGCEYKPWEPELEELDSSYYTKFSVFDKIFRPWTMRRKSN